MKGQFPPQGTKCVDCQCCQATVYAGNDPLCWECDEQKPCRGTKRPLVDASVPEISVPEPTRIDRIVGNAEVKVAKVLKAKPAPPPRMIALDPEPLPDLRSQFDRDEPGTYDDVEKPEVNEEKPMPKKAGDGRGHRIDDATRAAIQAEPDSMNYEQIGRKYNISGVSARVIRLEGKKKLTAAPKITPITNAPVERVTTSDAKPGSAKISVYVEIDEIWADRYWAKLDLEQKAAMIQMQLLAIVERAQA